MRTFAASSREHRNIGNYPMRAETIMSTITGTRAHRSAAFEFLARMAGALKHAWEAYHSWRIREATIAYLRSMSDRQLEDIGLTRSQIDYAVRGALNSHRDIDRDWSRL